MQFKYYLHFTALLFIAVSLAAGVSYLGVEYLNSTSFGNDRTAALALAILIGLGIGGLGCVVFERIEHQWQQEDV